MRLIGLLCAVIAAAALEPPEITATTIDVDVNTPGHSDVSSQTIPQAMHADTQTLEPSESSTTLTSLKLNLPPLAHLSTTVSTSSHTVDTSVATPSGELDMLDAAKASSHSSISFVGAVAKAVAAIEDVIIGWPSHESIEHHSAEAKTAVTNPDGHDDLYTTFSPTLTAASDPSVTMCINSNASSALNFDHEDGDDGTDVKIIKDIMARTLENTLEEVALAVEHETINSTGSMPNMYQESTMYEVNATRSDSAEIAPSTDVGTTKTQTETAAPSAKEEDVTALASSAAETSVSSDSKVSANLEAPTTVEKKPDTFTETLVHTIQTTTESIQTKPRTLNTSNANPTAPPNPKNGEKRQPRSSKLVEPPSASTVPKMAPSKRKKKDDPYNQASFDCGALILATNKGASSTTSILNKSKDQYMLNRCKNVDPKAAASSYALSNNSGANGSPKRGVRGGNAANSVGSGAGANFVIIELCNTIKIDTLVLANFEYFSSTFKDFNVYITDQYPPKVDAPLGGWSLLGSFHAANVRDFQYFKVKEPLFFTRFVKIEFLTYFGNEYYCPLTQVKAFGKTEIEAFREEEIISMAAELAEQEEAAEETLRTIALRAVKEIDAAACIPGDVVCEEAAAAVAERFVLGDIVPGASGTAIFGTPGSSEENGSGILFGTGIGDVGGSEGVETTKTLTTGTSSTSTDTAAASPHSTEASSSSGMSPAENPQSYILSADYFRLFMENQDPTFQTLHLADNYSPVKEEGVGEHGTPVAASNSHAAPVPSPSSVPLGSSSQESIFKTISKRLTLLERNATLSYKYIEEQSRAYHAAFVRVEIARSDSIRKALGECNKTMTRVVRELAKDYEAAWGLLLRDLERQRKLSDSRIKDVEKSLEKLSERMTRQIFYEFILVILLVLILTRIFTPTPINGLSAESNVTPLGSPRGFRKRLSPYFARYATKPRQLDSAMDSDAYRRTASSRPQFRSLGVPSAEFAFMHEEEDEEEVRDELEDNQDAQLAVEEEAGEIQVQEDGTYSSSFAQRVPDEQESEGSDVDYASVSESYRFGVDSPPQVATELDFDGLGVPLVPMPAADLTNGTKVKQALQIDTSNSHTVEEVGRDKGENGNPGKGRVNAIIDSAPLDGSPSSAKSEPVTPHMSSSSRTNGNSNGVTLNSSLSPPGMNAMSKKKKKRRRSLAGLRLESLSETAK
ncbi:hypothetical protein CcCBS67573_g06184 [Chytriomyces confervae]|uniref:SUN domain-containing protein n=1 Tax=Chytriomyces confervae TaxID=246404 RepID=A0A507F853_9FUNG|nr:hypothetical protein CcCBS67573_g06184 [Chytriomyces confervae]